MAVEAKRKRERERKRESSQAKEERVKGACQREREKEREREREREREAREAQRDIGRQTARESEKEGRKNGRLELRHQYWRSRNFHWRGVCLPFFGSPRPYRPRGLRLFLAYFLRPLGPLTVTAGESPSMVPSTKPVWRPFSVRARRADGRMALCLIRSSWAPFDLGLRANPKFSWSMSRVSDGSIALSAMASNC